MGMGMGMDENYMDGEIAPADAPFDYPGYQPSNVSKDARYTLAIDGHIRVQVELGDGEYSLLSTVAHPDLVTMVRTAKAAVGETEAGVFYINEFGHVLVKAGGRTLYAGKYGRPVLCRNEEAGLESSPI